MRANTKTLKMKTFYKLAIFLLVLLSACTENYDDTYDSKGQIQFSYNETINVANKSGRLTTSSNSGLPNTVIVGIQDVFGNTTRQSLSLNNFNDHLITSPISLAPGYYEINEFLLCIDDSIIMATPHDSSNLAAFVDNPLNINFNISIDEVTKVIPEVLSTKSFTPEDFGYATFGYQEFGFFSFLAAAFVWDSEALNYKLTQAELQITSVDNELLYSDTINAITNIIPIKDSFEKYIITCKKNGYKLYSDSLSIDEIKQFSTDPLEIILVKEEITPLNSLIAFYPFNGNANDESGNNYHGTVFNNNASLTTDRTGTENSAYLFAGNVDHYGNSNSQYIAIPNTIDSLTELTLSIWFELHSYLEAMNHWDGIISFGLHNTNKNTGIIYSADDKKIYFSVRVPENKYHICSVDYDDSWTNTFKHYALTYNSNNGELLAYIDGEQVASKTECSGIIESPDTVAAIGGHYWADVFSARLNGKVDDAKIFNRSLSAEEIRSLYNE